jgi:methionyl-tRNA synthetase
LKSEFRDKAIQKILNKSLKIVLQNFTKEFLTFIHKNSENSGKSLGISATLFIGKVTSLVKEMADEAQLMT